MELSMAAGTIKHPIAYDKYVDESFAKAAKPTLITL
jgi:NitT/TauT family transport system substrate-binding protein